MKIQTRLIPIAVIFCLATFVPRAQPVVPAPDGGYPNGNTAEGQNALLSLTTGGFDAVNAMLLNEFLKAHERMDEQQQQIEELKEQLNDQAAQIQRLSAQLELSKSGSETVATTAK